MDDMILVGTDIEIRHVRMDKYGKQKEDCIGRAQAQHSAHHAQRIRKGAQEAETLLWQTKDQQDKRRLHTVRVEERNKQIAHQAPEQDDVNKSNHVCLLCNVDKGRYISKA